MGCDDKRLLEEDVDSNAHHLQRRLKQKESASPVFDLGEITRMAKDLIDSIETLRKHEDQHKCNA